MAKVLIVCASRSGETVSIGNLIAEGIRIAGHEAVVVKDMISGPLRLKSSSLGGGIRMAQDYGREIAKKL